MAGGEKNAVRTAAFFIVAAVLTPGVRAGEKMTLSPAAEQGWQDNARFFANDAAKAFASLGAETGKGGREDRLGLALSYLSYQPVTVERLASAREILTELAQDGDEPGLAARYFLARMVQNYQEKPDYAEAARRYRALVEAFGNSYWGQLAIGKLAILELYVLPSVGPQKRIAEAEKLLALCQPVASRELHMVIGDAMLYYALPKEAALAHLVAAEKIVADSALPDSVRAELMVQIINLSARTDHLPQAQAYAARFKENYPRDWRNYAIGQILAAVEAGREPPIP